jgi:hypothetical protein
LDSRGAPLHIETQHSHDGADGPHGFSTHHASGIAALPAIVSTTNTAAAVGGVPPAIPRTSPFGAVKSPHFAPSLVIEVPHSPANAGRRDTFDGVNVNTPGYELTRPGTDGSGKDAGLSPQQDADGEGERDVMSSDATRTERSDSGADGGNMPSGNSSTSGMPGKPSLIRSVSHNSSVESYRQTIAEMISQIRYAL